MFFKAFEKRETGSSSCKKYKGFFSQDNGVCCFKPVLILIFLIILSIISAGVYFKGPLRQDPGKVVNQAAPNTADFFIKKNGDKAVSVKQFGAKGDGVTDDTLAIQRAIDSGSETVFFPPGEYIVNKNRTLNFIKHDEPCLYIKERNGLKLYGTNATLHVPVHGQGILEIYNSSNIVIQGICFKGYGGFPAIGSPSGRCEKGKAGDGGYYDKQHKYQWSLYKNNSVDTSSYRGVEKDAARLWGTFGGGFIGNCGSGVLVYGGCDNIVIEKCEALGFNHCGFEVGTRCSDDTAYNRHIIIRDCYVHDIFTAGIQAILASDILISGCRVNKIGHPSAFTGDKGVGYIYNNANPGYGISFNAYQKGKEYFVVADGRIEDCTISDCIRKGIDSHGGRNLTVINNTIENAYAWGIAFVGFMEDSGRIMYSKIQGNRLTSCGLAHKGCPVGILYRRTKRTSPKKLSTVSGGNVISGNVIVDGGAADAYGIITVDVCSDTKVEDNTVSYTDRGNERNNIYGRITELVVQRK